MAYVIAEPCIGTKDNSCVEVCPVDCIHPTPDEPDYEKVEMLYIDPEECIDCDACVEACPWMPALPRTSFPTSGRSTRCSTRSTTPSSRRLAPAAGGPSFAPRLVHYRIAQKASRMPRPSRAHSFSPHPCRRRDDLCASARAGGRAAQRRPRTRAVTASGHDRRCGSRTDAARPSRPRPGPRRRGLQVPAPRGATADSAALRIAPAC